MKIKDILKARRLSLGLTLEDVAAKVGVSAATISRWESGDIANMRRDRIVALSKALKISPAVIMGWDDPEDKPVAPTALTRKLLKWQKKCKTFRMRKQRTTSYG